DKEAEITQNVKTCIEMLERGKMPDVNEIGLDVDTKFYLLGLTPNSSRLSIKLFYENSFGKILENVQDHIENILVKEGQKVPSVCSIASELVSPNGSEKMPNASLVSGLLNSVITRTMYPQNLLSQVLLRIKTDQDDSDKKNIYIKINDTRVGIIKAYLNRKNKINNKGEMITMALNEKNLEKPYLCGRLFAVLEKLQKDAIGNVNSNIKSRYFSSACVTPAMVFPRLIKLAQNHINKLENSGYIDSKISEIINLMGDNFPSTLSIEDQGKFVIGYYQQNKDLYTKKGE
ncbi:MAG: type I-C CRISPR-associated protein Cas8c/Csd1, partial [Clostridia bacterium]